MSGPENENSRSLFPKKCTKQENRECGWATRQIWLADFLFLNFLPTHSCLLATCFPSLKGYRGAFCEIITTLTNVTLNSHYFVNSFMVSIPDTVMNLDGEMSLTPVAHQHGHYLINQMFHLSPIYILHIAPIGEIDLLISALFFTDCSPSIKSDGSL